MFQEEAFAMHFGLSEFNGEDGPGDIECDPAVVAVLEELRTTGLSTDDAVISTHGYGYGADSIAVGITLTSAVSVLLSGKRIEENIDAWLRLGRRLRSALTRLRERQIKVAMSQPAATAVAIATVSDGAADTASVSLVNVTVVGVENRSLTPEAATAFLEHPDRYYLFTFRRDHRLEIICMTATGEVVFNQFVSLSRFAYGSF